VDLQDYGARLALHGNSTSSIATVWTFARVAGTMVASAEGMDIETLFLVTYLSWIA
jgi:hypothetical protein